MKPYERRAIGKETYFKLAAWDALNVCWKDGDRQFGTEAEARAAAIIAGRYRINEVGPAGRRDMAPFEIV